MLIYCGKSEEGERPRDGGRGDGDEEEKVAGFNSTREGEGDLSVALARINR
jgi:hypothetical protein